MIHCILPIDVWWLLETLLIIVEVELRTSVYVLQLWTFSLKQVLLAKIDIPTMHQNTLLEDVYQRPIVQHFIFITLRKKKASKTRWTKGSFQRVEEAGIYIFFSEECHKLCWWGNYWVSPTSFGWFWYMWWYLNPCPNKQGKSYFGVLCSYWQRSNSSHVKWQGWFCIQNLWKFSILMIVKHSIFLVIWLRGLQILEYHDC